MDIKKLNPWNWFSREDNQLPATAQMLNQSDALVQLHQDLDRTFNNMLRSFGFPPAAMWQEATPTSVLRPHVDVVSGDKEYVVTVEVPGVEEKDVKLELSPDGALVISGQKRQQLENTDRNVHRIERSYGAFRRVLSLPEDADRESLDACFKNGVLTITCPRRAALATPAKQIEIKKVA